jgi:transposase
MKVITVSVDEKPGVQAISNTAPDLPPVPGKHPTVAHDHEYKRLGTCSILAALDLHTGHVAGRVERRHRSREFIALLRDLDDYYPKDCTLRLVLDNHSAHLSQETQAYLATRPNRFKYVLPPTHGSWLNLAETLFGKMARTFLRHIRVHSWEELRERTLASLKAARAPGRKGGRPKKLSPKELKAIRTLLRSNEVPVQDIAARFGLNRSTLYRNMTASTAA